MLRFLRNVSARRPQGSSFLPSRAAASRHFSAAAPSSSAKTSSPSNPEYEKRNYAKNISEYNTVLGSITGQRRCYGCSGDIDRGVQTLEDHLSSKPPAAELYVSLAQAAIEGYTAQGMQVAQETLEKTSARGFFLNAKMGSDLLLAASGGKKALAGLRRINLDGLRWRVFDAKGQVLGRLASQIATVVQGKDKPTYTPYREDGDMCVIINAKDICVTGRKLTDKFYRWHTGYVGNLKERSLKDQLSKDPTKAIRKAVLRMLPRNKLRDDRDRKLRIFAGSEHPFGDRPLEPYIMPPRNVREMRPRARRALIRAQKKAEQSASEIPRKKTKNKAEMTE